MVDGATQTELFTQSVTVNRKVIFFNGPPHCGKDTISDLLAAHSSRPVMQMKFADPLKDQCAVLLGVTREELELIKDIPHPVFNGGTPRQYLINLSEKLIKPVYGDQFFGNVSANKIDRSKHNGRIAFSDSGFLSEAIPVVNLVGIDNCAKIEIHRKGKDFKNDSRSYWHMPGLQEFRYDNDGNLEQFLDWLWKILRMLKF